GPVQSPGVPVLSAAAYRAVRQHPRNLIGYHASVAGALAFALSASLLLLTSWLLSSAVHGSAEKFWVFVASAILQLGVITTVLSLFKSLAPAAFLAAQLALLVAGALILVTTHRTRAASNSTWKQSL